MNNFNLETSFLFFIMKKEIRKAKNKNLLKTWVMKYSYLIYLLLPRREIDTFDIHWSRFSRHK